MFSEHRDVVASLLHSFSTPSFSACSFEHQAQSFLTHSDLDAKLGVASQEYSIDKRFSVNLYQGTKFNCPLLPWDVGCHTVLVTCPTCFQEGHVGSWNKTICWIHEVTQRWISTMQRNKSRSRPLKRRASPVYLHVCEEGESFVASGQYNDYIKIPIQVVLRPWPMTTS
jgi:hypothetical protein